MNLLLPHNIYSQLVSSLEGAGAREIGGALMGEHVGPDTFRVVQITVQRHGGTFAAFTRFVEGIVGPLRAFFRATNHNYRRFNYLGEWHSHHAFSLTPSGPDHASMQEIVSDPQVGAQFAVLLLVKLNERNQLEHSLSIYQSGVHPTIGNVLHEE